MYQQKHGRPRIYWPKANSIYGQQKSYIPDRGWFLLVEIRGQRDFSIPGILDKTQLHFFSLDHEKWFSKVSISSWNMRITIWNLVLVSKYQNGHMIISISSRQARARKIILNLVSKNCTFSREWEWDSKSKPITVLHRRKSYDMIFDKWSETCMRLDFKFGSNTTLIFFVVFEKQIPNPTSLQPDVCY